MQLPLFSARCGVRFVLQRVLQRVLLVKLALSSVRCGVQFVFQGVLQGVLRGVLAKLTPFTAQCALQGELQG